ncbi:hypothetical protein [Acidocella sp.]|uniref:hypothetical protein n=1 Tax=Acidocella sp. TaxID=50710 RepID=UPI0026087429|nr:hypothetical protein [Acidocella sp.]
MKRLLLSVVVLLLLVAGGYWLWAGHKAAAPPLAAANQDARPLTGAEQAAFLPLVCAGASAGTDGYAHDCASLTGYPSSDYGGAGLGLGMTLTSVILGHISDATADEAYVSYQGSFESHADNFGGGILFRADGKGGWVLEKWVPGGAMDGCLALDPQGRSRMLCLRGASGQGETDTVLGIATPGAAAFDRILVASDLRDTMDPNANCALRKSASQDVLLGIDSIARAGAGYAAAIEYVPASIATAACASKSFASAAVSKTTLIMNWDGSAMHITPALNVAPGS